MGSTYDKSLDEEKFKETVDFGRTKIVVGVYSYDGAAPKLRLSRLVADENTSEYKFVKIGGMTKEELDGILPVMQKGIEVM